MVGFRAFVLDQARSLGVVGWVRNLADGSVEALIQGPQETVGQLQQVLGRGPAAARVDRVTALDVHPSEDLRGFNLVP